MCLKGNQSSSSPKMNGKDSKDKDTDDANSLKATLRSLNEPQSTKSNSANLHSLGSTPALLKLLQTCPTQGIPTQSAPTRRTLYGSNSLPTAPRKSWIQLFIDTFDDETLKILIAAAVVSLAVGIYDDPSGGYVEGCAILAAVLIVSIVTACNDYQKETQFRALAKANDDVNVLVIRDGKTQQINVVEIVLGDILLIEAGDAIPCDGVLIKADSLEIDESALTGEPIDIEKDLKSDPFVLSGCIATAGTATFVAIAVGKESQWGVIKSHLEKEQDQTPLQEKLDRMAEAIGHVGMVAAAATFIAMMVIKVVFKPEYLDDVTIFAHALEAFIIGVTIVVVAVPEGLPLAVTISLAYSTKKMLADNNLIRVLAACETMGNATNICSDKTGTLTENRMTVVKGIFANVYHDDTVLEHKNKHIHSSVSSKAKEIILQGIATCSTAKIMSNPDEFHPTIVGNKTEAALLLLAQSEFFHHDDFNQRRKDANFGNPGGSRIFPFSSSRKRMSVLVKEQMSSTSTSTSTLYHKGAGEIVLKNCTSYLDADGSIQPMTTQKRQELEQTISKFASQALRCVALSHRDNTDRLIDTSTATAEECAKLCEKDMCLDALVGIVDPLRQDVLEAVTTCQKAGIIVRMVTGDNLETAIAIAKQAGILTKDGLSMVGEDFRKLTPAQLDDALPRLQVLARSSPEDKHILVQRLNGALMPKTEEEWLEIHPGKDFATQKDKLLPGYYDEWAASRRHGVGEVVGVTGDGTNDGPALKAADVGLSMGISGTDVAKHASDIIIMDDKFSSIVKAALWGRSVFDNIRKFLQFQLTVNVVALTITFLTAVVGYKPPLNAVMMLWVNLIMDTMGALALGTEPPAPDLLDRRPYKRDASLISLPMWRNILIQASYQLGLLIFLLRKGPEYFGCIDGSVHHFTILFNAFVFCQVFNEFNAREIGDIFNPFKALGQSPMFLLVIVVTVLSQWLIVEYGGDFTQTSHLTYEEWKVTVLLGATSIPVGFLMRLVPISEDPESFAGAAFALSTGKESDNSWKNSTNMIAFVKVMAVPVVLAIALQLYSDA